MKNWLKRLLFGTPETAEEREERRKAKIYMLSACAGAAVRADKDGKVRVEDSKDEDNKVCGDSGK